MKHPSPTASIPGSPNRYEKSPMNRTDVLNLFDQLEDWIHAQQAFLQIDLGLQVMARELSSNSSYLSRAINEVGGKGVNQYINSHRIRYCIGLIKEGCLNRQTLSSIAKQSGFGSFSTFSRAFKQEMGCSPTDYIKQFLFIEEQE